MDKKALAQQLLITCEKSKKQAVVVSYPIGFTEILCPFAQKDNHNDLCTISEGYCKYSSFNKNNVVNNTCYPD